MHVAIVTDRAYLPWCATTIASCVRACDASDLAVHIIHSPDVSGHEAQRLAEMVDELGATTEFHPIDESAVSMLPSKGRTLGGRISWIRIVLPHVLAELDRVVYLDADTLVVSSLEPLWNLPLGDAPLGAVANVTEPAMYDHTRSLGIEDPKSYFNAGVLVINLQRWRDEGASDALMALVATRQDRLPWFDQDALNSVFAGRWLPLHPRWNAMNSLWTWRPLAVGVFGDDLVREAVADPAVLHFEGPTICKPWHYLCSHPRRHDYRATLARTPWAATPLQDHTLATRAIARLPVERRVAAFVRLHRARLRIASARSRLLRRFPVGAD